MISISCKYPRPKISERTQRNAPSAGWADLRRPFAVIVCNGNARRCRLSHFCCHFDFRFVRRVDFGSIRAGLCRC